jgi:adenine deaminase
MAHLSPIQLFEWPVRGLLARLVVLICCFVFISPQVNAQESAAVLLFNVNLIDVNTGGLETDSAVLVQNSRIANIGEVADMPLPQNIKGIDGQGGFLIPGLWGVHVHLSYTKESVLNRRTF